MVDGSPIIFYVFLMVNDNLITYFTVCSHFATAMVRLTDVVMVMANLIYTNS